MVSVQNMLYDLIRPVVEALGCELWGLEFLSQGHQATLRVYIDNSAGESVKSVSLHDCERVSRQVSSVLDVEDPITAHYILEVSSPGMDRPLFTLSHYRRFIGEKVIVRLNRKFEERKKFTGVIVTVENDEIVLQVDDEEYSLPVELIEKANIVPVF